MTFLMTTPNRIVSDKFTSLGIIVTRKLSQLLRHNWYEKIDQLERNMQFWNTLPVSMVGRINSIKMVVLPRFLYIFQSIPVCIPQKHFRQLDSIVSSFIWSGKIPRISKKHLIKSRSEGGFGLLNLDPIIWLHLSIFFCFGWGVYQAIPLYQHSLIAQ